MRKFTPLSFLSLYLMICFFLILPKEKVFAAPWDKPGWELTFQDEFDNPTLERNKWNVRYQWGETQINNELQAYIDDAFNFQNGILNITGERKQASYGNMLMNYTSGVISSGDKFSQQYGYFEIRCQMPKGKGLWPAFWMSPQHYLTNQIWEIDIHEFINDNPYRVYLSNHWGTDYGSGHYQSSTAYTGEDDFTGGYHTFAIDWQADHLTWYVDGQIRKNYTTIENIPNVPMIVKANFAIGGNWPGNPDDSTLFPNYYNLDYIRVYRRVDGIVSAPTILPQGRTFIDQASVALNTTTTGAEIRYTLEGSNPTTTSFLYTEPINLTKNTLLKAQAFKTDMTPSNIITADFSIYPANTENLPGIWRESNIGIVKGPGFTKYLPSSSIYLVYADGMRIGGTYDSFHYIYQSLSGNGEISARIIKMDDTNPYAKIALMARKDLTDNARQVLIYITPQDGGGQAFRWEVGNVTETRFPLPDITLPIYFKLVRNSENIFSYVSDDGVNWTTVGNDILPAGPAFLGIASTSGYNGTYNVGVIDNLNVLGTTPYPTLTPIPPTPTPFLTHCQPLGNIDCLGTVNVLDLSMLISKFGGLDSLADLDDSGKVNVIDLSILLANFGR